ncbi:MAG: hypothetical protein H7Z38_22130 [Rubrivivax sp.]|nr:hypothetical protein [Pyrinomonadaceae bacterium]
MSLEFKAVRILPFTEAEKKQLIRGVDDATKTYSIPFKFSAVPDPKWAETFMIGWHKEYGGRGIIPRINGNILYVSSSIQNLQNALNGVKLVTAETNERFQAVVDQAHRAEAEARRLKDESKCAAEDAMTNALDKLQF